MGLVAVLLTFLYVLLAYFALLNISLLLLLILNLILVAIFLFLFAIIPFPPYVLQFLKMLPLVFFNLLLRGHTAPLIMFLNPLSRFINKKIPKPLQCCQLRLTYDGQGVFSDRLDCQVVRGKFTDPLFLGF